MLSLEPLYRNALCRLLWLAKLGHVPRGPRDLSVPICTAGMG